MIIRTKNKDIKILSAASDSIKRNGKTYPGIRFNFEHGISTEDVTELLTGTFQILDDEENVQGEYDGYTTLKNISISIGKITSDEQRIEELEMSLAAVEASLAASQEANEALELENAELLFNSLTGEDFNEVSSESITE